MSTPEQPKLIVDSDWKAQAQAEKERLAAQAAKSAPKPSAPGSNAAPDAPPAPGDHDEGEEKIDFDFLVQYMLMNTLSYMGAIPDPRTGQAMVSLEHAAMHIQLLTVLEEKTKGNLSEKEKTMLTRVLHELRMQYVEITKAVEKAVAEGRVRQAPAAGRGPATPGIVIPAASPGVPGSTGTHIKPNLKF